MTRTSQWRALILLAVVVSACIGARAAEWQAVSPVPDARGAISGAVLDAASGKPVAGAVVTLAMRFAAGNGPTLAGASRQVTDSAGRYVFTQLPARDFTIVAGAFGYFDGGYGRTSQSASNRPIALKEGEWFQNATIKLWRQGSINGTVIDEAGEPVVGVWVRALAEILVSGVTQWVSGPLTKTDDRGMYRFAALTPGKWAVQVPSVQSAVPANTSLYALSGLSPEGAAQEQALGWALPLRSDAILPLDDRYRLVLGTSATPPPSSGGRPQVYPITFYPSARTLTDAVAIDLSDGEERSAIDVTLRPVPAFKISGVLDGPPGAMEGLVVRLMVAGTEGMGPGNEAGTTLAEANGAFTFLNIPSGAYTLIASRSTAGYSYLPTESMPRPAGQLVSGSSLTSVSAAPEGTMFETSQQPGDASFTAETRVEVGTLDQTDVVVHLDRGVSISGHVVTDATPGAPPSHAMPFFLIRAEPAGGEAALGQPQSAPNRNDPSGAFRVDGLQRGEYLLKTVGGGMIKSIIQDGKDYTSTPFDTSGGHDLAGVVVTLTDRPAKLEGTVRDAQGLPVASGAATICFPANPDQWSRYGLQPARLRSVPVANNGLYRFSALPAGDYLVIAVDDAHADAWKEPSVLQRIAPAAQKVTLGWGDAKTLDLTTVPVREK